MSMSSSDEVTSWTDGEDCVGDSARTRLFFRGFSLDTSDEEDGVRDLRVDLGSLSISL